MDRTAAGVTVLVGALVLGAAVWILTTSPLAGLLALLGGMVMWEVGRRTRYGGRMRFLPRRGPARPIVVVSPRRYHRTPWHRPAGSPQVVVLASSRPRRPGPPSGQRPGPRPAPGPAHRQAPRPSSAAAPRRNGSRP